MFVVGKYIATKVVAIGDTATSSIKVKIQSMSDERREAINAEIDHLKPPVLAVGSELTDAEKAEREKASDTWYNALAVRHGLECIRGWEGVGACDDDGKIAPIPCTPENITALMEDPIAGWRVLRAINEVNVRVVEDAGNA